LCDNGHVTKQCGGSDEHCEGGASSKHGHLDLLLEALSRGLGEREAELF